MVTRPSSNGRKGFIVNKFIFTMQLRVSHACPKKSFSEVGRKVISCSKHSMSQPGAMGGTTVARGGRGAAARDPPPDLTY